MSSPSSSSSTNLQFFLRTSSGTLTLRGPPNETIENVIRRAHAINKFCSNSLRLHNGKRRLPLHWTISRCGIQNDCSLELVHCLEVRRSCLAWKVANDLLILIYDIPSLFHIPNLKETMIYFRLESLVKKFVDMTPTGDENDITMHLQVFFDSGVHVALRKLYQSPFTIQRKVADFAVRMFLKYSFVKFFGIHRCHFAPVLFVFCKLFVGVGGKNNPLYLHCRNVLATLVDSKTWRVFMKPKSMNFMMELYPYVVELAEEIIVGLSSESMSLPSIDVTQFSCFLNALRWEIKDAGWGHPIPKEMHAEKWIKCLYEIFIRLLMKIDESFGKIESFMIQNADVQDESQSRHWASILTVIYHCRKLGKIYEYGRELILGLLQCRRVPLNALIRRAQRSNKCHWLLKHKELTDFETRRSLVMMLFAETHYFFYEPHEVLIERSQLLKESFIYIGQVDPDKLQNGLSVQFVNEEATGDGVLREWFCLVCQAIFNPQNKLFLPCLNDRRRFFPNSASLDTTFLNYFKFAGRVIALALIHKVQVGITFDRVFFLQLAGKTISLEDIKDADPFLHMSCKKILEMDAEILDSDALGLTFVREIEELGCRRTIEICPGGKEIPVNSRNRTDFTNLLVQSYFVEALSKQIDHFFLGVSEMLSDTKLARLLFRGLDLEDFDRMLGGSEDSINVEDWKAHTEYQGYGVEDQEISWFWKVVEGMQEQQKRILLVFWTSLRYLPVEGFSGLESKLVISKGLDSEKCLPSSQTCFYLLLLPPYPSFSIMHQKLQLITQEYMSCTFGFC